MKTFRPLFMLIFAVMFLFAGCVQAEPEKPEDKTKPEKTYPEIYRFVIDTDAPTLDPVELTDTVSDKVVRDIFDCLVKFDKDLKIIPSIAEEWIPPEKDGTEWIFKIRHGVKFHNGREVTANDVEYSLTRVFDKEMGRKRAWVLEKVKGAKDYLADKAKRVEGFQVIDEYTFKITLEHPFAPFLGLLAMSTCSIVPREEIEKLESPKYFSQHPIGTGPFIFKKWDHDHEIVLEANPDYFMGAPKLKGVTYRIIREPKSRVLEFENGNIEHCDIPPQELDRILADPKLSKLVVRRPLLDVYHLGFNCQKAPFKNNKALRQAFSYAIDKEHIAKNILNENMEVAKGYIPPGMPNYTSLAEGFTYDVQKARDLLAEAGYPDGKGLKPITLWIDNDEIHRKIAESVQNDLKKINVNINIKQQEWAAFLDAVDNGEAQFHQLTWLADYPDPDNFLYVLLDTKNWGAPGNQTRFSNKRFDELVEQAQKITDWTEREKLYQEAESIVMDECPWLLLFTNRCNVLVQPYVKGLEITALDRSPRLPNVDLENVWFEE